MKFSKIFVAATLSVQALAPTGIVAAETDNTEDVTDEIVEDTSVDTTTTPDTDTSEEVKVKTLDEYKADMDNAYDEMTEAQTQADTKQAEVTSQQEVVDEA
jgi:hypothetical protein